MNGRVWTYALLAGACALPLLAAPAQYFGRQNDDILYAIASQALAGGSYRLFTAVGRPFLTFVIPGLPILLLPVSWLAPERLGLYEAFSALCQAALPLAAFGWLRAELGALEAALCAALLGASPLLLSQAGAVMPEAPFALAMLALLASRSAAKRGGWLAALVLLRPAGLSLVPAAAAPSLRKPKDLARALGPAALALGVWLGWSWSVSRGVQEAGEWRQSLAGGLARPFLLALDNARFFARALGGQFFPVPAAAVWLGAALLLAAGYGTWLALRRKRDDGAALALVSAAAMHAAWGWQYERYWIPLLPLFWRSLSLAFGRRARYALFVLLAAELSWAPWPWLRGTAWRTPELSRTYAWLDASLPPDAAIASAPFARDGFHARRPAAPLPDESDAAAFAARLRAQRVRYALVQGGLDLGLTDAGASPLHAKLARAERNLSDPATFELIHEDHDEDSRVYRLKQP